MSSPRVCVALSEGETVALFPDGIRELERLAELHWPADQVLPPDVGTSFDACITGWSTIVPDQERLAGGRLRHLIHTGASVRPIVDKATCGQVDVSQPGAAGMALAVAEMSLALSLVLLRDIHSFDRQLHAGADWVTSGHGSLRAGLADSSIGILGLGRTGSAFAAMCHALDAKQVLAYDPYCTLEQARSAGVVLTTPEHLFRSSDLVVNHLPSTRETHTFVDARRLSLMRDDGCFVNTARAWSVDMTALAKEIATGRLKAALDVFDDEPLPAASVWRKLKTVLTPHVAGGTIGARRRQGQLALDELLRALRGDPLHYLVSETAYDQLA